MTARSTLATALLLCTPAFLSGCKSDSGGGGTPTGSGYVSITTSTPGQTNVVANGSNVVSLEVVDSEAGTVTVTTTRGTFVSSGTATATVQGATNTLALLTCNAETLANCAGTALVRATRSGASDSVSIVFGSLASVCPTNCAADAGCAGRTCTTGGTTGTCSGTTPSQCVAGSGATCTTNPAGATSETSCTDGIDNDCDDVTDCADPDCDAKQCQTGSPTFICKSSACTDTTSGLAIAVTPVRTRLPANGTATTLVEVLVTSGTDPAEGLTVSLTTTAGAVTPVGAVTDADGIARYLFTAPNAPAVASLTAAIVVVPTLTAKATITMPALGVLKIPETSPVDPAVLGAQGSGFQESGYVSVLALDTEGLAYPDGLAVRFEHHALGGSTFAQPLAADTASCVAAAGCVATVVATNSLPGTIDTLGQSTAWLQSGRLAGALVTTASATVAGVTRTVTLPTVAVVGAKTSGNNFSIVCGPRNVPALGETDCAVSLVDEPFTCQAMLKDRFSNVLGRATQVIFASEVSAVGPVVTTPQYTTNGTGDGLGIAAQTFETLGAALPFDVAPAAGEPSVSHALDGCGTRTHNPRDGVVTVIAIADGEEGFFDSNGNGRYDAGEPFVDVGEPFVDQDDDGVWTSGEWFLDVDGDSAYTPANGAWDAAKLLWTQTVVVYTGYASTMSSGPNVLGTRWVAGAAYTGSCVATPPAPAFAVSAEQPGPPVIPASSAGYVVVASDWNLNRLATSSAYAVEVSGTVSATYGGLAKYVDDLGIFYRYWPCDQNGNCAAQCRATGAAAPCEMAPSLSAYTCGVAASVVITGGSEPDPSLNAVDWNVDTTFQVYGTGKTVLGRRQLVGTSN